jgi:chemotaxis protein methyltransferase CheR
VLIVGFVVLGSEAREGAVAGQALSDRLFQQFSRLVYQQSGISLHEGKKELLQARLNKRLRATGLSSYGDYYEFITSSNNSGEIIHFLDCISTNLTYFFREPKHFEFLDQIAMPELLASRKHERNLRIRVWSAACSTGEEPYSLAMCLLSHLEGLARADFRILATDISTRVLDVAVKGSYPRERIEKVPPALRQKYFQKGMGRDGETYYQVSPLLKQIVTFRRLNLQTSYPFSGPFDYIFCRNVMIYFDKQTQQELVRKMAEYLSRDGYLFVGHSESLTGLNHPLTYVRPSVYKK